MLKNTKNKLKAFLFSDKTADFLSLFLTFIAVIHIFTQEYTAAILFGGSALLLPLQRASILKYKIERNEHQILFNQLDLIETRLGIITMLLNEQNNQNNQKVKTKSSTKTSTVKKGNTKNGSKSKR